MSTTQAVVSAFTKLADLLPQPIARHVAATMLAVGRAEPNEPFTRNFAHVARGLGRWTGGRVRVRAVRSATRGAARVRPYFLEPDAASRNVYLIGFDETVDAMRTYKVERIGPRPHRRSYEIPDDFDPDAWLAHSWGIWSAEQRRVEEVRLRFDAVGRAPRAGVGLASLAAADRARRRPGRAGRDGGRHRRDPALDPVLGRRGGGGLRPALREAVARMVQRAAERYAG